jgi:hypothetical protein
MKEDEKSRFSFLASKLKNSSWLPLQLLAQWDLM